jgi:hypothetical protein
MCIYVDNLYSQALLARAAAARRVLRVLRVGLGVFCGVRFLW